LGKANTFFELFQFAETITVDWTAIFSDALRVKEIRFAADCQVMPMG
jgi:hypothetical protein